jgi:hypothetical protein
VIPIEIMDMIEAAGELWLALMSDDGDRDQCGVPIGQQRHHVAVEKFIQAGAKIWNVPK